MPDKNAEREPIPEYFASYDEAAEFWDNHDLADYEDATHEVGFDVDLRPFSSRMASARSSSSSASSPRPVRRRRSA